MYLPAFLVALVAALAAAFLQMRKDRIPKPQPAEHDLDLFDGYNGEPEGFDDYGIEPA